MAHLTDAVGTLFDGKNFAVLSTLDPDGAPHSTVVWVRRAGDVDPDGAPPATVVWVKRAGDVDPDGTLTAERVATSWRGS